MSNHHKKILRLFVAASFIFIGASSGHAQAGDGLEIDWRVKNPFRFFTDDEPIKLYRAALAEAGGSTGPVHATVQHLNSRSKRGWIADYFKISPDRQVSQMALTLAIQDKTCWSITSRTIDKKCKDYVLPKSHDVVASIRSADGLAGKSCRWTVGGEAPVDQPCQSEVTLSIPYTHGKGEGPSVRVDVLDPMGNTAESSGRETIKVQDLFILGMGDSFASGEGNPDVPVLLDPRNYYAVTSNLEIGDPNQAAPKTTVTNFPKRANNAPDGSLWLDRICHRSFYSPQFMAALHLAATTRHTAIGYLGLACSGAEIDDGVLGEYKGVEKSLVPLPKGRAIEAQITAAQRVLCGQAGTTPWSGCPSGTALPRPVDLLYVSIGGNDIGFSRLVTYILANQSVVAKLFKTANWLSHEVIRPSDAEYVIQTELGGKYDRLNRAISGLVSAPQNIILTSYPLPLNNAKGHYCASDPEDSRVIGAERNRGMEFFNGELVLAYDLEKAKEVATTVGTLQEQVVKTTTQMGWTLATDHLGTFSTHGWCAVAGGETLDIPTRVGKTWNPYDPSGFRPYDTRQRWFRTPNDAYMTVNYSPGGWVSLGHLGLAANGSMHPTAEGHAAIADALVTDSTRQRAIK